MVCGVLFNWNNREGKGSNGKELGWGLSENWWAM